MVSLAYFSFIILGLFDGLLGVAWPSLRASFNQPIDALGLLLAVGMVGHITASLANGRLITKAGVAGLLIGSAILLTMGAFIEILASVWLIVLMGGLLIGMGMGMLDAGMNTFAAANFRPRLINWLHASFGLGTTIGASLMTLLLAFQLDWRAGIGTLGGLYLVLALLFIISRQRWQYTPESETVNLPEPITYAHNRDTLRLPVVWITVLLFFIYTGVEVGVGHWIFTLFTESRQIGQATAGLWATLYWGSFMAGRILLGFIETRLIRLVRLGLLGAILGSWLLTITAVPLMGLIGIIVIGISIAPIFPALVALTPARVGESHAPNSIGFEIGAAGLGGASIPALAGVLGDAYTLEIIPWFIFITTVLQFLIHELLVVIGKRPLHGKEFD